MNQRVPINPIMVVNGVIDEYRNHLMTEFRARDPKLREALEQELDAAGFLAQEPFFQAYRPFKSGKPWSVLGLDSRLAKVMEDRTDSKTAFLHQSEAIEHLLSPDAQSLVVTTGTGSGKTECFLLPVIQNAIEDASRFKKDGLTAILVYPMNALANDQEERIRAYLEVSGHSYVNVARYDRSTKQDERDRLRRNPPHILLTNYVMLEYLLVRPADREDIFANHRCRYLVLDEVHSYRGSLGANIALLVRRAMAHLTNARQDWNADDRGDVKRFPKLVRVGTSATIKSVDETGKTAEEVTRLRDEAVQGFFSTLSGTQAGAIRVIGESIRELEVPAEARWPQDHATPAIGKLREPSVLQTALCQLAGVPEKTVIETAARNAAILWKLGDLLARRPLSLEQAAQKIREEIPERQDSSPDFVKQEVKAALVIGSALPDGTPGALRLRTHRLVRGGWRFYRCVDPECGRLYPMGQDECSCGKRTAPLYICRSCGTDTLRFSGSDDPTTLPLEPNDERGSEGEWVLYDLGRIDELSDADDEVDTDRQMRARAVVEGSFDPENLQFSTNTEDYPVRCALAPGRTTCLVCGGTAGSKNVITPVALGTSAAVRVLAEGLIEGLAREHAAQGPDPDRKERLLIFADSRQDAAHQARFITYAGRYDRMRRRLVEVLQSKGTQTLEGLMRELTALGVRHHDNPHTTAYDREEYLPAPVRERAMAWEEAPVLDEIAITAGYRATTLNLGIVGVRYQHLDRYVAGDGAALAAHLGISPAQLEFICRCLLDEMRRRGALSRPMLAFHPANPSCPESYRLHADWERKIKNPAGYAWSGRAPLAFLDAAEVPSGISLKSYWKRPGAGGRLGAPQRILRTLLSRFGGNEPTNVEMEALLAFLAAGPHLIAPVRLHGFRQSHELLQVNADCLSLEILRPEDRFRCSVCNVRMPWVVEGTPCPSCKGRFQQWPDAEVRSSRYVERILRHELIPLVAGEHTAQVAGDKRIEIEADFKGSASRSPLNVLACSPTLEMGIDVGTLDAVLLRNVPPRPDNYAQRGGRAGRRSRVGIVLGYARNTPHDGYFYDKPGEMIAGEVPAPGIGLGNRDVTLRHLHSLVFGSAEPGLAGKMAEYVGINGDLKEEKIAELIQALESKFDHAIRVAMAAWGPEIRDPAGLGTEAAMRAALETLPGKVRDLFNRVRMQILQLEETIRTWQAMGRGDRQAMNAMDLKRRLLGIRGDRNDASTDADDRTSGHPMRRFAEFGILPGYEFPSEPCTVRLMGDQHEDEPISVERRFGLAQYQPEARAHARGHRWKVVGLDMASPWNPRSPDPDWVYSVCRECDLRYGTQEHARCPRCGSDATLANGLPGHAFGGFLAVRDDTPVLEEEDRFSLGALVQAHPQHDGFPMFRYDLPTGWRMELRRGETIRWINEWKAPTPGDIARGLPTLHEEGRGFYLCPHCGRILTPPEPEPTRGRGGRRRTAQRNDDSNGHAASCVNRGQPPVARAITARSTATSLRIFVDLPNEWSEEDYARWGYSLGYALRTGMRHLYMLDGPEIEFTLEPMWETRHGERERQRGALTFFDPAVGGSGFLDRAAAEMHLVARRTLDHLDHPGCETACYRCLKSYNNQRHHLYLAWPAILPELEQLASAAPVLTDEQDYNPGPWLEAYDAGVGSPLELAFLRLFERRGIEVEKQVAVSPEEGGAPISVADFVVKGTKTAIYVDGAAFHRGIRLRRDRNIRERLAQGRAGWRVVALTAVELKNEAAVVAKIK